MSALLAVIRDAFVLRPLTTTTNTRNYITMEHVVFDIIFIETASVRPAIYIYQLLNVPLTRAQLLL